VRDSVELEWAGIPAVAIVHEAFVAAAQATASVSGMAGYEFVVVSYPLPPPGEWTDQQIDDLAKQVAPAVARLLTRREEDAPGTRIACQDVGIGEQEGTAT
jgi:hypothetical protein